MSYRLFVSGVAKALPRSEFEAAVKAAVAPSECESMLLQENGVNKGFAFVTVHSTDDVAKLTRDSLTVGTSTLHFKLASSVTPTVPVAPGTAQGGVPQAAAPLSKPSLPVAQPPSLPLTLAHRHFKTVLVVDDDGEGVAKGAQLGGAVVQETSTVDGKMFLAFATAADAEKALHGSTEGRLHAVERPRLKRPRERGSGGDADVLSPVPLSEVLTALTEYAKKQKTPTCDAGSEELSSQKWGTAIRDDEGRVLLLRAGNFYH